MNEIIEFTDKEKESFLELYSQLKEKSKTFLNKHDEQRVRKQLSQAIEEGHLTRDFFGLNPIITSLQTAILAVAEIGLRRDAVLAIMLYPCIESGLLETDQVGTEYGDAVGRILHGLQRIQALYKKNPVVESENFRNLLLSFAEDMRVILIMIADRVNLMRQIRDTTNDEARHQVSEEAAYLYAPLAHKL